MRITLRKDDKELGDFYMAEKPVMGEKLLLMSLCEKRETVFTYNVLSIEETENNLKVKTAEGFFYISYNNH